MARDRAAERGDRGVGPTSTGGRNDSADLAGLVPSRRAGRRERRRAAATAPNQPADPLAAVLGGVVALQSVNETLLAEVRELRRKVTALTTKVDRLDERLTTAAGTDAPRTTRRPARKRASTTEPD